jgi:hypothetical protein
MSEGVAADTKIATIVQQAKVVVAQEAAAKDWAVAIALMAYAKTRAEYIERVVLYDDASSSTGAGAPGGSDTEADDSGLTTRQKLAIAVLGVGAVGGLLAGPLVLAATSTGTAVMLLLTGRRGRSRTAATDASAPEEPAPDPEPVGAAASTDNPFYKRQPDHMVPKYRFGDATAGERQ